MHSKQELSKLFNEIFDYEPDVISYAPGRVNLIGDHTDYNDGFVLPAAIDFATSIAASLREDRTVRAFAKGHTEVIGEFSLDDISFNEEAMWLNYLAGTLKILLEKHPDFNGADLVVLGDVPFGVGLSSSASFEIAIVKTFSELYDLGVHGIQAALIGQRAENEFVGCNCGIMDQLISAMGHEGHAMLLDCRDLSFQDATIPDTHSIMIINSNVKRELVDSQYNERRRQCEEVSNHFDIRALRDLSIEQLQAEEHELGPELYRRAKHVVTENSRTKLMYAAMNKNDIKLMSRLMRNSHVSMRDDYEITTIEIDGLVDIMNKFLGDRGGVRMTGGGFGGCVVALVPHESIEQLQKIIYKDYWEQFELIPEIFICKASQGAFRTITTEE